MTEFEYENFQFKIIIYSEQVGSLWKSTAQKPSGFHPHILVMSIFYSVRLRVPQYFTALLIFLGRLLNVFSHFYWGSFLKFLTFLINIFIHFFSRQWRHRLMLEPKISTLAANCCLSHVCEAGGTQLHKPIRLIDGTDWRTSSGHWSICITCQPGGGKGGGTVWVSGWGWAENSKKPYPVP